MTSYRILFAFDAFIAVLAVMPLSFLLTGRPGSLSLLLTLLPILGICVGSLWWASTLSTRGRPGLASLVLLIPAVPAFLALLALAAVILIFSMGGVHH